MASHWTSKNAILRDLSVAQGREVPVEIVNAVSSDEKPPALHYTEETEEEFYAGFVGSADFETGPDLKLIQQMLDMVREAEIKDIEDEEIINTGMILEISKANAQFVSEDIGDIKEVVKKPKKSRNVAVASLLETYGDSLFANDDNEKKSPSPKLLKPDDFMSNTQNDNNSEKNSAVPPNKVPIITSPISMFKKKSLNKNPDNMLQKKNVSPTTNKVENDVSENKPRCFVPSSHASERYKAYLEKSKLKEQVKEDIWARAERQMKDIDAKRREESLRNEMTQSSNSSCQDLVDNSEASGMDFVRLPQHRHLLTGDCTVCRVLCVHRKDEVKQKTDAGENSK